MGAETVKFAERVGHLGQGLAQMLGQHLLFGHIVGHPAHTVHVVGKGDQLGRYVAQRLEGAAHHGGTRDLAEGADMGQARGAIAGLEQDIALVGGADGAVFVGEAGKDAPRLLKRPRLGVGGGRAKLFSSGHFLLLFGARRTLGAAFVMVKPRGCMGPAILR